MWSMWHLIIRFIHKRYDQNVCIVNRLNDAAVEGEMLRKDNRLAQQWNFNCSYTLIFILKLYIHLRD